MFFVMLTKLIGKSVHPESHSLESLVREVEEKIKKECPDVEWISNYALFGPYDYLDIFSAPNLEEAMKVSALVRTFGRASTEIWPALQWEKFKEVIGTLPEEDSFKK